MNVNPSAVGARLCRRHSRDCVFRGRPHRVDACRGSGFDVVAAHRGRRLGDGCRSDRAVDRSRHREGGGRFDRGPDLGGGADQRRRDIDATR